MGAFGFDGARGGENENVLGVGICGEFDSWFGANEFNFGVIFTEFLDTFDCSSITGDDDDFGTPFFEGFDVFGDNFHQFFIGFFAVRAVFGIGNVKIFLIF